MSNGINKIETGEILKLKETKFPDGAESKQPAKTTGDTIQISNVASTDKKTNINQELKTSPVKSEEKVPKCIAAILDKQVNPDIAEELVKNGLDKNKILLTFDDYRLKDPYKSFDNHEYVANNKNWNLVGSYHGFMAFQYGTGDYLQTLRLVAGSYAEIFSKAVDKQQTLRKIYSTGEIKEVEN